MNGNINFTSTPFSGMQIRKIPGAKPRASFPPSPSFFRGRESVADFHPTCFPGQPSGKRDEAFRHVVVSNINWNMILSLDRLVHPNMSRQYVPTYTRAWAFPAFHAFPIVFSYCLFSCASSEMWLLNSVCILIFDFMSYVCLCMNGRFFIWKL